MVSEVGRLCGQELKSAAPTLVTMSPAQDGSTHIRDTLASFLYIWEELAMHRPSLVTSTNALTSRQMHTHQTHNHYNK